MDPKTRRIEEVGEGVDYGVRKRRSLPPPGPGKSQEKEKEEPLLEDEKFLKGVRICRQCRPVLMWVSYRLSHRASSYITRFYRRQQYQQEVAHIPTFSRLYEVNLFNLLPEDAVSSFPSGLHQP